MPTLQVAPPSRSAAEAAAPLVLHPLWHHDVQPRLLTAGRVQIGTGHDCELQLRIDGVAEHHAMVLAGPHKVVLRAWDPRTWVNDAAAKEVTLRPGDRVAIGPVLFRVRTATTDELLQQLPEPEPVPVTQAVTPQPRIEARSTAPTVPSEPIDPPAPEQVIASTPEPLAEPPVVVAPLPVPTAGEIEALIAAQLEKHRATWEAEHAAWDQQQAEWLAKLTERMAQLDRRDEQLTERTQLLDAKTAELERRDSDVVQREQALARRIEQHDFRAQQFARQQADLADEARRCEQLQRQLDEQQQTIRKLRSELQSERDQLESLLAQAREELQAEAERQTAAISAWETHHGKLTAELAERLAAADQREAQLAAQSAQLARAETEVGGWRAELEADRVAFCQLQEEFAIERQHWAQSRAAQQSELEAVRADWDRHQEQIAAELKERSHAEAELIAARQALQHDRRRLAEQEAEWLRERESHWEELATRRRRVEEDAATLEREHRLVTELVLALEAELTTLTRERDRIAREREEFVRERQGSEVAEHDREAHRLLIEAEFKSTRDELQRQSQGLTAELQKCEQAQWELAAARQRLERDRQHLAEEQARWIKEQDDQRRELDQRQQQLELQLRALEAQQATLVELQSSLEREIALTVFEREQLAADRTQLRTAPLAELQPAPELTNAVTPAIASSSELSSLWHAPDFTGPASPAFDREVPETFDNWQEAFSDWGEWTPTAAALEPRQDGESVPTQPEEPAESRVEAASAIAQDESNTVLDEARLMRDLDPRDCGSAWTEAPFELEIRASLPERDPSPAPPELPPGDKPIVDSVNSLRAELARLFGLPEDFGDENAPQAAIPAEPEPPALSVAQLVSDVPTDQAAYTPELSPDPRPDDLDDWRARLQTLMTASEPQSEPEPIAEPVPPASDEVRQEQDAATESHDEDSIASYMERLLARNKKADAPRCTADYARQTECEPEPDYAPSRFSEALEDATPNDELRDRSHLTAAPRVQQDKHELRANLQSFRQVANLSARNAIATHSWRVVRTEIALHGLLSIATGAVAAAFFYPPLWDGTLHASRGAGCVIASLWSLRRCAAALKRLKKCRAMENRITSLAALEDHLQPRMMDCMHTMTAPDIESAAAGTSAEHDGTTDAPTDDEWRPKTPAE